MGRKEPHRHPKEFFLYVKPISALSEIFFHIQFLPVAAEQFKEASSALGLRLPILRTDYRAQFVRFPRTGTPGRSGAYVRTRILAPSRSSMLRRTGTFSSKRVRTWGRGNPYPRSNLAFISSLTLCRSLQVRIGMSASISSTVLSHHLNLSNSSISSSSKRFLRTLAGLPTTIA